MGRFGVRGITAAGLGALAALATLAALAALAAAHAPAAGAATIGELPTSSPSCEATSEPYWFAQSQAAANAYTVPSGGGYLTSWSMAYGAAGSPVGLLVLAPEGGGKFAVVALDSEHLPSPLPPGRVSTFTFATPIHVLEGDTLGLLNVPGGSACAFATPSLEDSVEIGKGSPAVGGTLNPEFGAPKVRLDVRAEVLQSDDASLTQSVSPATVSPGGLALITLQPHFSPSLALPATISDTLPTGLTPVATASGAGGCSVAGQTVTCQSTNAAAADIVVSAGAAGAYTNTATVSTSLQDPDPANNSATGTLTVTSPPPPPAPASCHPLELAGVPLSAARTILTALDCTVGTVTSKRSSTVSKGLVVSDNPSGGTLPAGTAVDLVVSIGPNHSEPVKHKRHKRHRRAKSPRGHRKR